MNDDRLDATVLPLGQRGLDRRALLRLTGAGAGAAVLAGMPGLAARGLAAPAVQDAQPGGTLIYCAGRRRRLARSAEDDHDALLAGAGAVVRIARRL